MSNYKILFFLPSPRNIPEVKNEIVANFYGKHDVIWYKFFKEIDAYEKAREFFLKSAENYDYLCIIPDDLLLNKEGVDNLLAELQKPSINIQKYDVLAGICNSSYLNEEQMERVAASNAVIPDATHTGSVTMWNHLIKFKDLENRTENIFQCKWIGFSFYFIHRSVVQDIPFRVDDRDHNTEGVDNFFSNDLEAAGYKQYIDKRSRFVHLKGLSVQSMRSISVNPDILLVGKIKPHVIFVKKK